MSRHAARPGWPGWVLPAASSVLAAAPFLLVAWLVRRYAVDVPVWDQWELVPLLEKSAGGVLGWRDLWAQHNEHRLLFPRLIMLLLARASGWSIGWELVVNLALAAGVMLLLAAQLRWVMRAAGRPRVWWWLLPVLALQIFSLQQYENWLWGWQIQIFLNVLAAAMGFCLLARAPFRWRDLAAAGVCGVVALYSFANGAAFWLIGGLLAATAAADGRTRIRASALWWAAGALVMASYLAGFRPNPEHPPLTFILQQPGLYAQYMAAFLGAPLAAYGPAAAAWAGLASLILFAGLGWQARGHAPAVRRALAPFMALALYSISAAAIAGLARAGLGATQALSSRYVTLACFLSLAIVILLVVHGQAGVAGAAGARRRWTTPLIIGFVLLIGLSSWQSRASFAERWAYLLPARASLVSLSGDAMMARLYPDPDVLHERALVLQARGWSVYRDHGR